MPSFKKFAAVAALAVPMLLAVPGTASASTPGACSSVTQIGSTAYLNVGGQTMASVKQYKGCGQNYSYLYVWEGYRSTHSSWDVCAAIVTNGGRDVEDPKCGHNSVELWSWGSDTLSVCTQAMGWTGYGPVPYSGDITAKTDVRC
ncbi:hypothetical protein [Kitasatospora phosalacinea]|uniref:Secreted protein n=1 Tax=Kitasatospora phosalacinea TaxID=2065 RepID=A0A9W6PHG1_9ACTN|nr:hypothetical protein [Kitasatospora phosalacinea]GLW55105.1 hypothetical protein Kpho01_31160 [Kitasatospora phosalacinea]